MLGAKRTKELLTAAPAVEPVSLDELKRHCRITGDEDDPDLLDLITAARQQLEEYCWSSFIAQTWDYWYDGFSDRILIPRPPLVSVSRFQYADGNGTLVDVGASVYELGAENQFPFARLKHNQTWPTTRGYRDDIYLRVTTGYGATAASVPMPLRHAIKLLAANFYMNRGDEISLVPAGPGVGPKSTMAVALQSLVAPYRFNEY